MCCWLTLLLGQAYVALSRATTLDGLQVKNFDPRKVSMCSPTSNDVRGLTRLIPLAGLGTSNRGFVDQNSRHCPCVNYIIALHLHRHCSFHTATSCLFAIMRQVATFVSVLSVPFDEQTK